MEQYRSYAEKQLPLGWKISKMKNIGFFSSSGIDKLINENELLVKIVNYVDVYKNDELELRNKDYMVVSAPREKVKKHQVCVGDLIFTPSSETSEDIGISAVIAENLEDTAFSYHLLRFQFTEEIEFGFKKYLCNNYLVRNYYSSMAKGSIRKTLSKNDFNQTPIIIPPLKEQRTIAKYLDGKIAQIMSFTQKLDQQLEMLELYKHELIANCITKGLDKTTPTSLNSNL